MNSKEQRTLWQPQVTLLGWNETIWRTNTFLLKLGSNLWTSGLILGQTSSVSELMRRGTLNSLALEIKGGERKNSNAKQFCIGALSLSLSLSEQTLYILSLTIPHNIIFPLSFIIPLPYHYFNTHVSRIHIPYLPHHYVSHSGCTKQGDQR